MKKYLLVAVVVIVLAIVAVVLFWRPEFPPSDELVVKAIANDIFDAPLEKNSYLKEYYNIDSVEKKSQEEGDLTAASQGVMKAKGRTIHTRVVLSLMKDCNSSRYHERYSIPACDLGSGPENSVENKGIPQHKKGQTFTIENIDIKFVKQKDPPDSPWQIF